MVYYVSVAETVWDVLNSFAIGGAVWLAIVAALALLGELGLPFTCPIIESLLVFTGFQLMHGTLLGSVAPFLVAAYAGRLAGSISAYYVSERFGTRLLHRHGRLIRVTPDTIEQLRVRLSGMMIPSIILARFTPGLTVLTSFVSGISKMRSGQFFGAVAGQLVAWEIAFLAAGALGGVAIRSLEPETYSRAIALIIGISLSVGVLGGYVVLQFTRRGTMTSTPVRAVPTVSRVQPVADRTKGAA